MALGLGIYERLIRALRRLLPLHGQGEAAEVSSVGKERKSPDLRALWAGHDMSFLAQFSLWRRPGSRFLPAVT